MRNWAIPRRARNERNPLPATLVNLRQARENFLARCAGCHGQDGSGITGVGQNLYPRAPDLRSIQTQALTDGQIHYIIVNGVQLTGMPAWGNQQPGTETWDLVLFIRSLGHLGNAEKNEQAQVLSSAHYVGSKACEKCHAEIYERWKRTPMANVVRDPREHPDAILPDLSTKPFAKFTKDQVALVYGSIWKQRYFTKSVTIIFPNLRNGTFRLTNGCRTKCLKERTGGCRIIRRKI